MARQDQSPDESRQRGGANKRRTEHLAARKPPESPSRDVGSASHGETNIDWLIVAVLYSVLRRGNCLLHLWARASFRGPSLYWTTTARDPTPTVLAASSSESLLRYWWFRHRKVDTEKLDRFLNQVSFSHPVLFWEYYSFVYFCIIAKKY